MRSTKQLPNLFPIDCKPILAIPRDVDLWLLRSTNLFERISDVMNSFVQADRAYVFLRVWHHRLNFHMNKRG